MPPRKRAKRDVDPPLEAPAEVLVKEQKPFPLLMLPQLVLHLVFSCLKPSEMSGISRSSTLLRSLLLPCFSVFPVFPRKGRRNIRPMGDQVMYKFPYRIIESLRQTTRVHTIALAFWHLEHGFQEPFVKSLEAAPKWLEVTDLSVSVSSKFFEGIVNHWFPANIKITSFWTCFTSPCRMVSNRAGQLTRVYSSDCRFLIRNRTTLCRVLGPWTGEKVRNQLEWFAMAHHHHWSGPGKPSNSVSDSEQMADATGILILALKSMPRLRRFAFWAPREELGPCLVRQDWTPNDDPLTSVEVDDWCTNLAHRIARSLPKLEQLAIMDTTGTVYMGTRASEGYDMTVSRKILEVGSQRFPQGIDD
ncbi:hypothetical protein NCS52_00011200 [Fusarium sp. LHS14.1]|nr:hypothetical protein NCS52_00011200 [Fusarium sp. LHS14.1]